ncbi:MAG: hypothetical protein JKY56_23890 [Kofleriaceae bacterium]|nr:hypothetical protein [Kofleriaceae bacterium]
MKLYQPYIVFGDVGAGKSSLIDRCIDWRGLAAQFHPSYIENPNLQIYQGSSSIVEEHSASLLSDTSPKTRRELIRLWRRLKDGKSPRVIVVLRADALIDESLEQTVRRAQLVRGKINILSTLLGRPIDVGISIVRMDSREGYLEFCQFLQNSERSLQLEISPDDPLTSIAECMTEFEGYLAAASTFLDPPAYLKSANFVLGNATLLDRVASFTEVLTAYDPATQEPILRSLVLASEKNPTPLVNPFQATITEKEAATFQPLRRHRKRAAVLAFVGIAYLLAGFSYEQVTVSRAKEMIKPLMSRGSETINISGWERFYDYLEDRKSSLASRVLPSFKTNHDVFIEQEIFDFYLDGIRHKVLIPRLNTLEARKGDQAEQKEYLYVLAILAGTKENETGRYILKHLDDWGDTTRFKKRMIEDYVRNNDKAPLSMRKLNSDSLSQLFPNLEIESWDKFFATVRELSASMEPVAFEAIEEARTQAQNILNEIEQLETKKATLAVINRLMADEELNLSDDWKGELAKIAKIDHQPIAEFLRVVVHEPTLADAGLPLGSFVDALLKIVEEPPLKSPIGYFRGTSARTVELDTAVWTKMVARSRVAESVARFTDMSREEPSWESIFFEPSAKFKQVSFKGGRGVGVEGIEIADSGYFTKRAYNSAVSKVIASLPANLETLNLSELDKQRFKSLITRSLGDYAGEYVDAYQTFYDDYRYAKVEPSLLPYVIKQLSGKRSVLSKFVKQINFNTQLELPEENEYADILYVIPESFEFVGLLVGEDSEQAPALAAYMDLLRQFAEELDNTDPFVGDEAKDPAAALKGQLSAIGRVALATYLNEPGAHLAKVEEWLVASGVPREYRYPFIGLFKRANAIGTGQIERTVATRWKTIRRETLVTVLSKFPFVRDSEEEASRDQVDRLLGPTGKFWTEFRETFGSLVVRGAQGWKSKRSRGGRLAMPARMLSEVNEVQSLVDTMWNEDGTPKPFALQVKSMPSSSEEKGPLFAVLATMGLGEESVSGFNQRPSFRTLSYQWWEPTTASVEVVFAQRGREQKNFRRLASAGEMWAFFRLLKLAEEESGPKQFLWKILGPRRASALVGFEFRENPWSLVTLRRRFRRSRK